MEKEEKDSGQPIDFGIKKGWLGAVVAEGIKKPQQWTGNEVKDMGPKRPESKIQAIIQQWYWDLVDGLKQFKLSNDDEIVEKPDDDLFDKWFENNGLKEYSHRGMLLDLFNTIARGLSLDPEADADEKGFQTIFSKIVRRCIDEPEYVEKVANIINDKYPGLATPFRSTPTKEEMQDYEDQTFRSLVDAAVSKVETNIEEFHEQLRRIEAAAKTDFETLARLLNEVVIFGSDAWELVLYSIDLSDTFIHSPQICLPCCP